MSIQQGQDKANDLEIDFLHYDPDEERSAKFKRDLQKTIEGYKNLCIQMENKVRQRKITVKSKDWLHKAFDLLRIYMRTSLHSFNYSFSNYLRNK